MSSNCFVPGCHSGYSDIKAWNRENGQKNPSLFRPRTDERIRKWAMAIKRGDKSLTSKDAVCELHFLESDIERFFSTKLPDGTVFQLKRGIPKLREDAVPTIFPSYPNDINKPVGRRKLPVQRDTMIPPKRRKTVAIVVNTEPMTELNEVVLENLPNQFKNRSSRSPSNQSLKSTKEDVSTVLLSPGNTPCTSLSEMMSAKKTVSNTNCCVSGCHTKRGKNPTVSFHHFPDRNKLEVCMVNKLGVKEMVDKHDAWKISLGMEMGRYISTRMTVCSLHFTKADYILPDFPSKHPRLKSTAVPSQNLPALSIQKKNVVKARRHLLKTIPTQTSTSKGVVVFKQFECKGAVSSAEQLTAAAGLLHLSNKVCTGWNLKNHKPQTIRTESQLNAFTGLPNFKLLDTLTNSCADVFRKQNQNEHNLSRRERILLTLMKLKTGMKYVVLAPLFSIGVTNCRTVFLETLHMLAKVLSAVVTWPSKAEVLSNMPRCFEGFQNVRVVVNCTEIRLEQAKCLCCRLKTCYHSHKNNSAVKFATGVSPGGLIVYTSKGYCGRCSDEEILKESGLLEKLNVSEDAVMVRSGFLIDDLAEEYGFEVVQPRKIEQFSEEEAVKNARIVRAQVHMERINQRLKVFEILNKSLPLALLPHVDKIFSIICGIVNLTDSTFNDN